MNKQISIMNEIETNILQKLKNTFGIDYSYNTFTGKEITTLDDFFDNAEAVKEETELLNNDLKDNLKTYTEFIDYLAEKSIGDVKQILEGFHDNDYTHFIGYVKTSKSIVNNKIIINFEIDGDKYKAEWQPSDNYAVWQTCGITGDDYSGYILFPTYKEDEYFCIWYRC